MHPRGRATALCGLSGARPRCHPVVGLAAERTGRGHRRYHCRTCGAWFGETTGPAVTLGSMLEREQEAHAVRRDTMTNSLQESIRTQVRTREGSAAMDDKQLDTRLERTTRNLVTGASRRRVLKGAIGGAAGGLGLLAGRPAATAEPGLGDLTAAPLTADRAGVQPEETDTTNNPNELTIENSALVLIDHQPLIALNRWPPPSTISVLINNVTGLAQAAAVLGGPTVLTTVGAQGSGLADPIFKEISDAFPDITPIDRRSVHAWSHPDARAAVDATGRQS